MPFKPTFLYIKQHRETKLLYFGKTVSDPEKYLGSGVYWSKHILKYGKDKVENIWYCLFLDEESLLAFANDFSVRNCIAESSDWANLIHENGLDGGSTPGLGNGTFGKKQTTEHIKKRFSPEMREKLKISRNRRGGIPHTPETKKKLSEYMLKKVSEPNYTHPLKGRTGADHPCTGKKRSEKFRKEQSERFLGEKNPMFGKKMSEATKLKKSEKMKGFVYEKVYCDFCGKKYSKNAIARHLMACKFNKDNIRR